MYFDLLFSCTTFRNRHSQICMKVSLIRYGYLAHKFSAYRSLSTKKAMCVIDIATQLNFISFPTIFRVHRVFVCYTCYNRKKIVAFLYSCGVCEIFVGSIKNDFGHEKGNQSITYAKMYMLLCIIRGCVIGL